MSYTPNSELTYQGATQSITDWALDYGIPPSTIIKRLNQGWPVGCAIGEPIQVQPGEKLNDQLTNAVIRKLFGEQPRPKKNGRELSEKHANRKKDGRKIYLTFKGEERSLNEWSAITGIKQATLRYRFKRGWSVATILNDPVSKNSRNRAG